MKILFKLILILLLSTTSLLAQEIKTPARQILPGANTTELVTAANGEVTWVRPYILPDTLDSYSTGEVAISNGFLYRTTTPQGSGPPGANWVLLGLDNLGDHTATTTLNMVSNRIINVAKHQGAGDPLTYALVAGLADNELGAWDSSGLELDGTGIFVDVGEMSLSGLDIQMNGGKLINTVPGTTSGDAIEYGQYTTGVTTRQEATYTGYTGAGNYNYSAPDTRGLGVIVATDDVTSIDLGSPLYTNQRVRVHVTSILGGDGNVDIQYSSFPLIYNAIPGEVVEFLGTGSNWTVLKISRPLSSNDPNFVDETDRSINSSLPNIAQQLGDDAITSNTDIIVIGDSKSNRVHFPGKLQAAYGDEYGYVGNGYLSLSTANNGRLGLIPRSNGANSVPIEYPANTLARYSMDGHAQQLTSTGILEVEPNSNYTTYTNDETAQYWDYAKITYLQHPAGGSIDIYVDNNFITNLSTTGAEQKLEYEITGLTDAAHTLEIRNVSGTNYTFDAYFLRSNESGPVVNFIANSGWDASEFLTLWQAEDNMGLLRDLEPDAVVVRLGTNDSSRDFVPATFKTNIENIVDSVLHYNDIADVALLGIEGMSLGTTYTDDEYNDELESLAETRFWEYISFKEIIPSMAEFQRKGFSDDAIHENPAGSHVTGNFVYNFLNGYIGIGGSSSGGGTLNSVVGGTHISVDNTDAANPVVNAEVGIDGDNLVFTPLGAQLDLNWLDIQLLNSDFNIKIGENAGASWSPSLQQAVALGRFAGESSTSTNATTFLGSYAGREWSGIDPTVAGYAAGWYGDVFQGQVFGTKAAFAAQGDGLFAGYRSGFNFTGVGATILGKRAAYDTYGDNVTAIGEEAGEDLYIDSGNQVVVTDANIDAANDRISGLSTMITALGLSTGDRIPARLILTTGTFPSGVSTATVMSYEVIDANTVEVVNKFDHDYTDSGSGTFTFQPARKFTNVTALGYNANWDQDNQVQLGDPNVEEVRMGFEWAFDVDQTLGGVQDGQSINWNESAGQFQVGPANAVLPENRIGYGGSDGFLSTGTTNFMYDAANSSLGLNTGGTSNIKYPGILQIGRNGFAEEPRIVMQSSSGFNHTFMEAYRGAETVPYFQIESNNTVGGSSDIEDVTVSVGSGSGNTLIPALTFENDGNINFETNRAINAEDPVDPQDLATKAYVDANAGVSPWTENGSDIYYNTGNVGIGTTTPGSNLHVVDPTGNVEMHVEGDDFATFRITADNAGLGSTDPSIRLNIGATEYWRLGMDNSSAQKPFLISPSTLSVTNSSIAIREDVNRVGIGGVLPQRTLDINGDMRLGTVLSGTPTTVLALDASNDVVDGSSLLNPIETNDYFVQESHSGLNQGIDIVYNPEGAEYVNENFTGQIKFTLPINFANARFEMKVKVMTRRNEARTGTGTLVFSWQERSGGGIDRSLAWVEATGITALDTLVWGADDTGGVTSIAIGEPTSQWDEEWSFKVTEFSIIEASSTSAADLSTGWSTSLVTDITTNGVGFTPMKGLQGSSSPLPLGMNVVEYPAGATWSVGDDGRDLNDQYIRVKIPLENRRIAGAFYHFQMKIHNDKEVGAAQVRTIDVSGDYDAGNFGVFDYRISGDQGSDMPLEVYAPDRDSSVYLFFGDGTDDYEHEKIVVTRWEWSAQRFYETDWGDYNNGWEVDLVSTIDKMTDSGPYTPDRERFDVDGSEVTYNGSTVDLAPIISANLDGNGILDAGPHMLLDGTFVRAATQPGGSTGRFELATANSVGGNSFNYMRAYGNNSKGFNLSMTVEESSGDATAAQLTLSSETELSSFSASGVHKWENSTKRRGFNWSSDQYLLDGSDFLNLPAARPTNDNSAWTHNSDGTFAYKELGEAKLEGVLTTSDVATSTSNWNVIEDLAIDVEEGYFYTGEIQLYWITETTEDVDFRANLSGTIGTVNGIYDLKDTSTGNIEVDFGNTMTLPDYQTSGPNVTTIRVRFSRPAASGSGTLNFEFRCQGCTFASGTEIEAGTNISLKKVAL